MNPSMEVSAPPLLTRLVQDQGAQWVAPESLEAWLAQPGNSVLLIAGDPVRFPEGLDVAVVLPELRRSLQDRFRIGVAEPEHEDALARHFGAQRRPSLVFLRDGQYVTTLSGMLDWTDFVKGADEALTLPISRIPIGIAVHSGHSACH